MEFLPAAFAGLKNYNQFIVYRIQPSTTRPGKTDKFPVDWRTKKIANAHNTSIWTTAEVAINAAMCLGAGYGVGFVLTKNDPYFFVDVDHCLSETKEWSPIALEMCQTFAGAAVETSSSGNGLHILGRATPIAHGCRNDLIGLEMYTSGRFVALTGFHATGNIDTDHTAALQAVADKYFKGASIPASNDWTSKPVEGYGVPNDDDLIAMALKSKSAKSAFGHGASFADLWNANESVLATAYPDSGERVYDASSADAGLAQHLAFWTANDCERIERLMMRSQLAREKWGREDYLRRTILHAVANKKEWYKAKAIEPHVADASHIPPDEIIKGRAVTGKTLLFPEQQLELFAGCVYVQDEHKILVPGGRLLKTDQFRAAYGGYSFVMDPNNERTSRNAWECFTESQAIRFPRAVSTCFRPLHPPGQVIMINDEPMVNLWWPVLVKTQEGDVTLFLEHLKKIMPDERDRSIFLAYIAACVQFQGVKFKWCPVIQGVDGNGKSLFSKCVAYAIGSRYTHSPEASEMTDQYNEWLYKTTFIAVEDVYIPGDRNELIEKLKPMVTEERRPIRAMYTAHTMRDICCNFIMNTNHKDGIRKSKNDRRIAPFFTAQQSAEDIQRDGLTTDYFIKLFQWLEQDAGYEKVAYFLQNYEIPHALNPANKGIAPITTSTNEAIEQGRGRIEQEILECIEQDTPGFKNGWLSSKALDALLESKHMARQLPPVRRRAVLQTLGYDYHPALKDGRVNNVVAPDGGKPRLYVKNDHASLTLSVPAEVEKAYARDQI